MDVPEVVASAVGEEDVVARVPLRGEDALYVTPTRTLVYTGDGLLSDAAVEEFGHDAERVTVTTGRRKATLTLNYGLDGEHSFAAPASAVDDVLHPVLAGVLHAAGVTGPGETVKCTYRFSELTLVVTSARIVKHVGNAVWDAEHEEIAYADVTGIDVEEGDVAAQLVLQTPTHTERIKTPADRLRHVREHVEEALFAYHDVPDRATFERTVTAADAGTDGDAADTDADPDGPNRGEASARAGATEFAEDGLAPLSTAEAPDDAPDVARQAPDASAEAGPADPAVDARPDEREGAVRSARDADSADSRDAAEPTAANGATGGRDGDLTGAGDVNPPAGADATDAPSAGAGVDADVAERLRDLEAAIERQETIIAEQRALVEDVARALNRDR